MWSGRLERIESLEPLCNAHSGLAPIAQCFLFGSTVICRCLTSEAQSLLSGQLGGNAAWQGCRLNSELRKARNSSKQDLPVPYSPRSDSVPNLLRTDRVASDGQGASEVRCCSLPANVNAICCSTLLPTTRLEVERLYENDPDPSPLAPHPSPPTPPKHYMPSRPSTI